MSKPFRFASAVSFAFLAPMLGGCATSDDRVASASSVGGKADGEVGLATRALAALNANDAPVAIDFAERAVASTPNDAGFRTLARQCLFRRRPLRFGRSRLQGFARHLANQPQVVLKLALVEIAQGKNAEAVGFLDANRTLLDIGNYGLALALAGQTDEAIRRSSWQRGRRAPTRASVRISRSLTRFAGDWAKARTIAAQDVPGNQLDERIQQWMQLAKPAHAFDQVAALTGVTPAASDPGQPVRLALRKTDTDVAQAAPPAVPEPQAVMADTISQPEAVAPQFAEAASAPLVEAPETVAPAAPPADPARVAAEAPAPASVAIAASMAPDAPAAFAAVAARLVAPAPKAKPRRAAAPLHAASLRHGSSGAVMQLGAYRSPNNMSRRPGASSPSAIPRFAPICRCAPASIRPRAPSGACRSRASATSAKRSPAASRCKNRGGSCFVRNFAGDAPVQFASR